MIIAVSATAKQKPVVSGQSSVSYPTNTSFSRRPHMSWTGAWSSDVCSSDLDSTPGAGYLTLDGAQISGSMVQVTAGQLSRVGYYTGPSGGANDIDRKSVV